MCSKLFWQLLSTNNYSNNNNNNQQDFWNLNNQDFKTIEEKEAEKIRNGWHECGQKVFECQKHGVFYCKVLASPTEKYCERCQAQKEELLKIEAWKKAHEKAQNWWKSLNLSEKQEQMKLLENTIKIHFKQEKNINDNEELMCVEWGNIYSGQNETYKNGKFSTTDIEQVPFKLVEKFLDNSGVDKSKPQFNQNSSNDQNNQSLSINHNQPNNQATNLNYSPQSLNNNLTFFYPSFQSFQNPTANSIRKENTVSNNQGHKKRSNREFTRSVKENFGLGQKSLKCQPYSKNRLAAFAILIIFTLFGGIIYWFKKNKTKKLVI